MNHTLLQRDPDPVEVDLFRDGLAVVQKTESRVGWDGLQTDGGWETRMAGLSERKSGGRRPSLAHPGGGGRSLAEMGKGRSQERGPVQGLHQRPGRWLQGVDALRSRKGRMELAKPEALGGSGPASKPWVRGCVLLCLLLVPWPKARPSPPKSFQRSTGGPDVTLILSGLLHWLVSYLPSMHPHSSSLHAFEAGV